MSIMQIRNPAQVRLLSADFQRRYESNFAWRSVCAQFQALPGLRGFWPMSSFDEGGDAFDLSEQGRMLSYNGNPEYNYDGLIHYIDLDGTGDYLSRADEAGLDIIGNEFYVAGAAQGLTIGGWFYRTSATGAHEGFMGKYDAAVAAGQSYWLFYNQLAGLYRFNIHDGAVQDGVESSVTPISGGWVFIVARFIPGSSLDIFVNDANGRLIEDNDGTLLIWIQNTDSNFVIGGDENGTRLMDGRASLCFLCVTALGTGIIRSLYQQSRALFGL